MRSTYTLMFLMFTATTQAELKMVAIANDVPVYVRSSQLDGKHDNEIINRAIEGELIVQFEKPWGPDSGSPALRSEIERILPQKFPDRNDFNTMLKREGMTYEDYIYEQRRIMAWEAFQAWIIEYLAMRKAAKEERPFHLEKFQKAMSAEERSAEYRAKVWTSFLSDLRANARIRRLQ